MNKAAARIVKFLSIALSFTMAGCATTNSGTSFSSANSSLFGTPSPSATHAFAQTNSFSGACSGSCSGSGDKTEEKIKSLIASMSLKEKLFQMFILYPEALEGSDISAQKINDRMKSALWETPVGGVLFSGSNLSTPSGTAEFIGDLQNASKIPLFIAVDEEGGRVARIANHKNFHVKKYSSMLEIGNSKDSGNAYAAGCTIGAYLSTYGFNVDFAPVADIFSNPFNTVIGDRSFGKDAETVSCMSIAFANGLNSKGIVSCFKHFPGHGNTTEDSHTGKVTVNKTWAELQSSELLPFISAIECRCDMIMIAHIDLVNVTADGLPASLSKELVTGKLRGELGYTGVVITDGLNMKAIESRYTPAEYAVLAVKAGVDILLLPSDFPSAVEALENAVNSGEISEKQINESLERIFRLKVKYGIL